MVEQLAYLIEYKPPQQGRVSRKPYGVIGVDIDCNLVRSGQIIDVIKAARPALYSYDVNLRQFRPLPHCSKSNILVIGPEDVERYLQRAGRAALVEGTLQLTR